jgi:hypothetical protein
LLRRRRCAIPSGVFLLLTPRLLASRLPVARFALLTSAENAKQDEKLGTLQTDRAAVNRLFSAVKWVIRKPADVKAKQLSHIH